MAEYLPDLPEHGAREMKIEIGPNGERLRFEPATGKSWVLVHYRRQINKHPDEGDNDFFYWEEVREGFHLLGAEKVS